METENNFLQKHPLALIGLRNVVDYFIYFLFPVYLTSLAIPSVQQGILLSMLTITALFTTGITGMSNDRISTRIFIIIGISLTGFFYVGMIWATTFPVLFILFTLGGIGINLSHTSLISLIFKTREKAKEGQPFGRLWFVQNFSQAVGIVCGGAIVVYSSFQSLFMVAALAYGGLIALAYSLKDTESSETTLSEYHADMMRSDVLLLSLIMFLYTLHWGAESATYSLFLKVNLGLSLSHLSLYIGSSIFFISLTSRYMGHYIDHYGHSWLLLMAGMIFSGIGHIGMTTTYLPLSYAFRLVHGLGDGIVLVMSYVKIATYFKRSRVGGGAGFMTTIMVLGRFVGTMVFAPLGAHWGFQWPLIISGTFSIVAGLLVLKLHMPAGAETD